MCEVRQPTHSKRASLLRRVNRRRFRCWNFSAFQPDATGVWLAMRWIRGNTFCQETGGIWSMSENAVDVEGDAIWWNMVKHGETWWLWVWKWLIIHPSHFEYSIDLDRFGGTLFSGKPANPTRFVGWNPTAPRYKGTVPLFSFHFFPHTMWILTHGEYYSQGKFNMFLLLYKWDGNSYNYQGIYHKFELLRVYSSNNSTLSYLLHKILEV